MRTIFSRASAQRFILAAALLSLAGTPTVMAQKLPPLAKHLDPAHTAIILVDFQNNFAAPEGEHFPAYKKIFEETKMPNVSVDLVKKGRALGVQVIEVYEGYSQDYRELDWSNPGNFHRNQILRQAWKNGTNLAELYAPLRPGPNDRDILLPGDRKSTRLNSSHIQKSRMPSSA